MAKVAYVVDDVLGGLCDDLGANGDWYSYLGTSPNGHYIFSNYGAANEYVKTTLDAMLEDDNPNNDAQAYAYYDRYDLTNYTVMYWSTEKQAWE